MRAPFGRRSVDPRSIRDHLQTCLQDINVVLTVHVPVHVVGTQPPEPSLVGAPKIDDLECGEHGGVARVRRRVGCLALPLLARLDSAGDSGLTLSSPSGALSPDGEARRPGRVSPSPTAGALAT